MQFNSVKNFIRGIVYKMEFNYSFKVLFCEKFYVYFVHELIILCLFMQMNIVTLLWFY